MCGMPLALKTPSSAPAKAGADVVCHRDDVKLPMNRTRMIQSRVGWGDAEEKESGCPASGSPVEMFQGDLAETAAVAAQTARHKWRRGDLHPLSRQVMGMELGRLVIPSVSN